MKDPRRKHKVTCAICGKEFETSGPAKCCSEECRLKYARKKKTEYEKARRARHPREMPKGVVKTCRVCGKEFTTSTSAVYCSEACRKVGYARYHESYQAAHRAEVMERDRIRHRSPTYMEIYRKICPQCGKPFRTAYSIKVFCGKACRDKWNVTPEEQRRDMRDPEQARMAKEAEAIRRKKAEAEARRKAEEERRKQFERDRIRRTESGAVWYPVSGAEIQRIARETHRSYGEVCAEFLSKQVKIGGSRDDRENGGTERAR